ncbi:hypothetical protein SAMN05216229_11769 [Geopseudomonas sagittaria]|uniref:Lipoprotein n=1 Tax=Geopseudomonas sagittaria TaxID=1135990 RepID=A0A1I5XRR0_9GAMM|nr:DUF6279 family lipoprotein [Pseudomonas sagittaria]SFQ34590.1 hypothetical protein SAMN05216229_11769 [Pseudomonas sagittaria]
MPRLAVSARSLGLLLVLLVLAACSRLELVYHNLDWLIPWKLDDYLSLDARQSAWLDARLDEHLRWHCRSELPRYLDWLERQRGLLAGSPDAETLKGPMGEARQLLQASLRHVTPDTARLLAGLSAAQVDELDLRLAAERARLNEQQLGGSPEQRLQRRATRAQRRLEDWLGPLHPQQRAYLRLWAARHEANVQPWLANRERWQAQLLDDLRRPPKESLSARLEPLLGQPERYWSEDYRRAVARAERSLAELLSELWASSTPGQRAHLQARLVALRSDLERLECRG